MTKGILFGIVGEVSEGHRKRNITKEITHARSCCRDVILEELINVDERGIKITPTQTLRHNELA